MPGNTFGLLFRITTFGESHGPAIGVVIDGVPAGLPLSSEDIYQELRLRRPGGLYTSPRRETDIPEIVSGVFEGKTTGMPIAIVIRNIDVDSRPYEEIRYRPRPGHADLPYIMKYGWDCWDYRGGGRASARETAARVAAGAVAKKLICSYGTIVVSYVKCVGDLCIDERPPDIETALRARISPLKVPYSEYEDKFRKLLEDVAREGDSVGGCVETLVFNVPPGLGEPVFDKLKADLAKAVMSIPGTVGVEFGEGVELSRRKGSEVSDSIVFDGVRLRWEKNVQGGIVGGLSNGEVIYFRVYFKPTSSIRKPVRTVDLRTLRSVDLSVKGRHDPCIAIRAVPVVEAMTAIVLADHMLRAGYISTDRLTLREVRNIEQYWQLYRKYSI